jgi:23S rRNA (uracil1939-C5)-methyltransferase
MHVRTELRETSHARIVSELLTRAVARSASALVAHPASARGVGAPSFSPVVHHAPSELAYRTRARLHFEHGRRGLSIGYLSPRTHDIVPIDACAVLAPDLERALPILRELCAEASGRGQVQIALGRGRLVVLELALEGDATPAVFAKLDAWTSGPTPRIAGARVVLAGASRPLVFGDPEPVQLGADGEPVALAPGGFGQPSDEGAAMLARCVADRAEASGKHVVELFSGSGTLSILLARDAASFVAVELDEAASRAARKNLDARGLQAKLVVGDADGFEIPKKTEVVVLDPPRTGARGAAQAIGRARPKRVVYVSCDPATLARDVADLSGAGYEIASVDTLELFPQTSHVETVTVLVRARGAKATGAPS